MGLRRGALSFTRLFVQGAPPRDLRKRYLDAVRLRVFQPLALEDEASEAVGWCVVERPFDLEFHADDLFTDRYLLLGFRLDKWRIPTSLLNAQLVNEEQKLLNKTGRVKLGRNERQELKRMVTLRLRRKVMPSSKSFDVCWDLDGGTVLFFCHSKRLLMDFTALFEKTFGLRLVEDSPYTAGRRTSPIPNIEQALAAVDPFSFSEGRKLFEKAQLKPGKARGNTQTELSSSTPGSSRKGSKRRAQQIDEEQLVERIETTRFLGTEFLLWIWARGDIVSAQVELSELGTFDVWLDNNLVFQSALDPGERVTVRGAAPAGSAEAREAVKSQKFPVRARLVLRSEDRDFALTLDAARFSISGGVIPGVLTKEADDAFLERMYLVEQLNLMLDRLYAEFLRARLCADWVNAWQPAIIGWLEEETIPTQLLQRLALSEQARKPARQRK